MYLIKKIAYQSNTKMQKSVPIPITRIFNQIHYKKTKCLLFIIEKRNSVAGGTQNPKSVKKIKIDITPKNYDQTKTLLNLLIRL